MSGPGTRVSASSVLDALRNGPFPAAAFAWLYEVSNGTGWGQKRYADALVLSCWPSRGIHLTGIEVKVDRADWVREFRNPEKAEEIRRWCAFWYLAAPPDVVKLDEVPDTWGFYEVRGKKALRIKKAPEQKTDALDLPFVASIFRRATSLQESARQLGRQEGRAECDAAAFEKLRQDANEARSKQNDAERAREMTTTAYDNLLANVRQFEREAGLPEQSIVSHRSWGTQSVAAQYKAALLLAERPPAALAKHFRDAADALDRVAKATKGVA